MSAAFDLAISGFGWLELTGDIKPIVFLADVGDIEPGDLDMDYTLTDATTGDEVASGTLTLVAVTDEFGGFFTGTITPSTALAVGRTYVETLVQADENITARRDAYATAWPIRSPLITDLVITTRQPILSKLPAGTATWAAILASAHYTLCQRIVRFARADVLTPSRLVEPETDLAIALALEALGVFPERALEYRDRFERQMEALRLDLDADGDGDADREAAQATTGQGFAHTQPAR